MHVVNKGNHLYVNDSVEYDLFHFQLTGDWRTLRKAFKNMDKLNTGYVSLKEFRSVLELCNVILDEEDWFQLMSYFDKDLTGKVPYNNFVNESVKPATSRGAPSRASTMMS